MQQQDWRQGLDQAAADVTGESVGAAQEDGRSLVADVLVIGMLGTEEVGWDADGTWLVRDVVVRPARHEGQVPGGKLQGGARVVEP